MLNKFVRDESNIGLMKLFTIFGANLYLLNLHLTTMSFAVNNLDVLKLPKSQPKTQELKKWKESGDPKKPKRFLRETVLARYNESSDGASSSSTRTTGASSLLKNLTPRKKRARVDEE